MVKKIIHVDMDAFYASVEQRDYPELRGKPIAIGSESGRGVVATASYEARKFGVHSAMPSVVAKRKCPNLIFVRGDMKKYQAVSQKIREIFLSYTPLVEPLSLDEAYLDVTENNINNPSATRIAELIKNRIKDETGLTASAGVSFNKFLAKIASDQNKPNGLFIITPEMADEFIRHLKIERFFGIGKVTAEKMHKMGIFHGSDLRKLSEHRLIQTFGKAGSYYYKIARGIDHRLVNPHRERKSVGGENTFSTDLTQLDEMKDALEKICIKVFERVKKTNKYGKTVTLKIKHSNFTQITRNKTQTDPVLDFSTLHKMAEDLLIQCYKPGMQVRLLGVSLSNFLNEEQEAVQLVFNFKYE